MDTLVIKRWRIKESIGNNGAYDFAKKFNIPQVALKILQNRKIDSEELLSNYLNVENKYTNPFDFCDMDKAVKRINSAIEKNEKICIYGDYDADGITATALIYRYLKSRQANANYYIPERSRDGYGLNKKAIDIIKFKGTDVILTVDNGSVAFDEVLYAKTLGIDTVITDHHKVMDTLPEAFAVVNPCRKDCANLEYTNFAGVGVAFKFVQAMEYGKQSYAELLNNYAYLVAIGTIGDSIKLIGETKNIVKFGIKSMAATNSISMKSLLKCIGAENQEIDSSFVAFSLVPRINACGRMENAEIALKLLISENSHESEALCEELNNLNAMRKDIENNVFNMAEDLLKKEPWRKNEKIIIAEGENWNHGVLGIVAARIMQKYGKPCIIITIEGEESRGSCRSFEDFSIYEVLNKSSEYLLRFGGHTLAAGFNILTENIENFRNAVYDLSENYEMPNMTVDIDLKLAPSQLDVSLVDGLKILEPFGNENPEPIFGFFEVTLKRVFSLSQGKHLKLLLSKNGCDFEVLCFNKTPEEFIYKESDKVDVAVRLSKNTYKGAERVSAYLVDLKLSDCNLDYILEQKNTYNEFKAKNNISEENLKLMYPSRNDLALMYRYIKVINNRYSRVDIINQRVFGKDVFLLKTYVILDIFKELGIIDFYLAGDKIKINILNLKSKVNIEDSKLFNDICPKGKDD